MIFLIEYSRKQGQIIRLQSFSDAESTKAETARLTIELGAGQSQDVEVVLLEAQSEADLRLTHRRYFASASDLLRTAADEAASARDASK